MRSLPKPRFGAGVAYRGNETRTCGSERSADIIVFVPPKTPPILKARDHHMNTRLVALAQVPIDTHLRRTTDQRNRYLENLVAARTTFIARFSFTLTFRAKPSALSASGGCG